MDGDTGCGENFPGALKGLMAHGVEQYMAGVGDNIVGPFVPCGRRKSSGPALTRMSEKFW
jgi:hypothetical protein